MILVRYDEHDKALRLYDIDGDLFVNKLCSATRYSKYSIQRTPFTITSQSRLNYLNEMLIVKRRYLERFKVTYHNVQ